MTLFRTDGPRSGVRCFSWRGWLACAVILIACVFVAIDFHERAVRQHLRWQRANISTLFGEMINQTPPADCQRNQCSYQYGAEFVRDAFQVRTLRPYNSLFLPKGYPWTVPPEKLSRFEDQLRDLLHNNPPSRALLWKVLDLVEDLSPPNYATTKFRDLLEQAIGPKSEIANAGAKR